MIEENKVSTVTLVDCWDLEFIPANKSGAKCKHRVGSCNICGTSDQKDKIHTTKNGKGLIARIKK